MLKAVIKLIQTLSHVFEEALSIDIEKDSYKANVLGYKAKWRT